MKNIYSIYIISGIDVTFLENIEFDRLIVENGCYQFQNNTNTETTVEELRKEFRNPDAVGDLSQPTWETQRYYPVTKFKIVKIAE